MKTIEKPQSAGGIHAVPLALSHSSKIMPTHLDRLAIVYVRQSSPKQVMENRESTERQYSFAEQAVAFGWPRDRVLTIDEDLGKSAHHGGTRWLSTFGQRGVAESCRYGAWIGDEPPSPFIERLACVLRDVRHIRYAYR